MTNLKLCVLKSLYTVVFAIAIPFILLRLLWRSRKQKAYRERWLERFGIFKTRPEPNGLWIHAVSVGETVAAASIIKKIREKMPHIPITITTTSVTGSDRVKALLGNSVFHVYYPYDLPYFIRSFLKRVRPKLYIIMETELWPNCLFVCKEQNIPVMIANACLSERSMRGYRRILSMTGAMLSSVTSVAAQTEMDGQRFIELGLDPKKLTITGNVKFDMVIPEDLYSKAIHLKNFLGNNRLILIAASTHPNEEEQILAAFAKIRETSSEALLLLVPRHPERFKSVADLVSAKGFTMVLRSEGSQPNENTAVYLGDTMGELLLLYGASDVAFVGGSLVPIGGHNILEAAALSLPMVVGPYIDNITETCDLLLATGALKKVANSQELAKVVIDWFNDPNTRKNVGSAAKRIVEENRGAIDKIIKIGSGFFSAH